LSTLQAASAGVVPMAAAYSASHELVKDHGEAIRVARFVRDGWGLRRALIDIDDAVGRLDRLYDDRSLLEAKSRAARRFAEAYSWQRIIPKWHELLQREVSRLRENAGHRKSAGPTAAPKGRLRITGSGSEINNTHRLSDHLQKRINKLEKKGELLTAEMIRDSRLFQRPFTVPVTPPLTQSDEPRITGRVYLASATDVPVFLRLRAIFPNLNGWSTLKLRLGPGAKNQTEWFTVVADVDFDVYLSATTLALDRRGVHSGLAVKTAKAGVPLIGSAHLSDQQWLWPSLAVEPKDLRIATEKAHRMFTDHVAIMEVCALATKRNL
jgi:hypothetical protein